MTRLFRGAAGRLLVGTLLAATLITSVAVAPATAATTPFHALTGIRVGRHATYDRVVLDFAGGAPTASHRYVTRFVAPSGKTVTVLGPTHLLVTMHPAYGYNVNTGRRTYHGPQKFRTFALCNVRQVAIVEDFEGYLSIGLGMHHRSWVHVFRLTHPSRVVIDVGR